MRVSLSISLLLNCSTTVRSSDRPIQPIRRLLIPEFELVRSLAGWPTSARIEPQLHLGSTDRNLGSVRLTVGVALPAEVAPVATVATLVRRKLRIAVRTDQPKVLPLIVR